MEWVWRLVLATKYYFHDVTCFGGPSDEQTSWTATVNASGYDTPRLMTTAIGSSQVEIASAAHANDTYAYFRVFCSPRLAAQTITSQTVTCAIGCLASENTRLKFGWGVYVWRNGSNVATIVANQVDGDGIDEAEEGRVDTATSTEQTLQNGDRICIEIWAYRFQIAGDRYMTFYYDGGTDPVNQSATSDAASYVEFATTAIQKMKSAIPALL